MSRQDYAEFTHGSVRNKKVLVIRGCLAIVLI